jgi:hypothetical protein
MSAQSKEYRCTGGQSNDDTRARVRTADKIDKAHPRFSSS